MSKVSKLSHNETNLLPQITHDLRNYINGISGLSNIVLKNIVDYAEQEKAKGKEIDDNLKEILECARMLAPYSKEASCYIDDMLNSVNSKSNKFSLGGLEECNVGALLKEMVFFKRELVGENRINVQVDLENNLPKVKIDVIRLKQIFINLITNALKYSHKGGEVYISVKLCQKSQMQIIIADSGIGMDKKELKMALAGDGQDIDKSDLDKPIDSHGLGLPIVKQLVDLLGMKMQIESRKKCGTKISLYIEL
jgi:signal transduction histidine kinase